MSKFQYVRDDGNAHGTLKHGMSVGEDAKAVEFEMRPVMSVKEMFEAEQEASVDNPLTFNGALMALQLVRVGEFKGPFTLSMIADLSPVDYGILRAAQMELSDAGN